MIICDFPIKAFHPGEQLMDAFLKPLKMKQSVLAERLGISRSYLSDICNGRRDITIEMALRLSRVFGTRPEWWLNLQRAWDMQEASQNSELQEVLDGITPLEIFQRESYREAS